jgi:hypothetical protein
MSQSKINDIKAKIIIALDLAQDDKAAEVLANIIEENHSIEDFIYDHAQGEDTDSRDQLQDFIDSFDESDADQSIDFDGNEYRIIAAGSIWEIYRDEIEQIVTDCYDLKLDKIPDFIAFSIDWERTAQNAFVDGYGHTFSSYDHSEIEVSINGTTEFHVFRTN